MTANHHCTIVFFLSVVDIFFEPAEYTICEGEVTSLEVTIARTLGADGEDTNAPAQQVTTTTRPGTVGFSRLLLRANTQYM